MFDAGSGAGGLSRVAVTTPDAQAEIYALGACVTHYQAKGKPPLLFCSRTSKWQAGKAIRGGIPIVFPWFGPHPSDSSLPQHGFARTADWTIAETRENPDGTACVVLTLESSPETRAVWPHDFALRYTVTVGASLDLALEVTNTSPAPFSFEEALHSYFAVSEVRQMQIAGLEGVEFVDKVDGGTRKIESEAPFVTLMGETDRVYLATSGPYTVRDPADGRTLTVEKENATCTVVWNPWETKAEAMADLAGGQWTQFLCVESANAAEHAVTLAPGETHTLRTRLTQS